MKKNNNIITGDINIANGETYLINDFVKVINNVIKDYPNIKFHFNSGNAKSIREQIENGFLDFGAFIEPSDITSFDFIILPKEEKWGILTLKDNPIARKKFITRDELLNIPLIIPTCLTTIENADSKYAKWIEDYLPKLHIFSTYNLAYSASILVENNVGYAIVLNNVINTTNNSKLKFIPFKPNLTSKLAIIWKKNKKHTPAAKIFLEKLKENFSK